LIDDQIAYLGSFNFTSSGVRHNYETSIKVKDPEAIQEVKKEIYQLMNHLSMPTKDIQLWGKQLYEEPIN
ncbi:MAG: phospholipase D-like domain-containing protein, partial [Bacteroidota bacterium]